MSENAWIEHDGGECPTAIMLKDIEVETKLTAPQKRLLLDFDERVHSTSSAHHKVIHALYRKGLVGYVYTFAATFFVIQTDGLRVAQHLKRENAK